MRVPRRRRFLARPIDSLALAAAKHAAIVAGEPQPAGESEPSPAEQHTHTEKAPRRRQAHDPEGRFT